MKKYSVKIKKLVKNEIVVSDETITKIEEISSFLSSKIDDSDLFPSSIVLDVKEYGSSACWCGSKGYGYEIKEI